MKKTHVIIHHSLTKDGSVVSWNAIRKYHMTPGTISQEGARDIGYHFGVELVGEAYEVLMGRRPDEDGAHCREANMNRFGLGVCFIGNFDEEVPSLGLWQRGLWLVKGLILGHDTPVENVMGHGEAQKSAAFPTPKTCPGKLFNMERFRADLRASF